MFISSYGHCLLNVIEPNLERTVPYAAKINSLAVHPISVGATLLYIVFFLNINGMEDVEGFDAYLRIYQLTHVA